MLKGLKIALKGPNQFNKFIFCPTVHELELFRPLWAMKLDKLTPNWPKLGQIQQGTQGEVKNILLPEVTTYLPII